MAVSPRETNGVTGKMCWRGSLCASLFFVLLGALVARAEQTRFFRIATAATGGSFFEIGGVVAGAISGPPEGMPCGRVGGCGVPGLIAVAQATQGSVENLRLINGGQIESGFAQADMAGWAFKGTGIFAETGPLTRLRAIASLFPESVHLVVRADSPIRAFVDLAGKRVSLGDQGSGSAADAEVLLAAAGLGEGRLVREYLRPGRAADALRAGEIDALFLVGGEPVPAIRDVAATIPIRLVPIDDEVLNALKKDFSFYSRGVIAGGTYPGLDEDTRTVAFSALWIVRADTDADLVYAITRSLWSDSTARLLATLDRIGRRIGRDRALTGLSVPLHPGAERFYREAGLSFETVPRGTDERVDGGVR